MTSFRLTLPTLLSLAGLALISTAIGQNPTTQTDEFNLVDGFESAKQQWSYAIGMEIGKNFGPDDLDYDLFLQAI
ncbi:MAG: hypothetical protein AAF514_14215, partial [Verrucomicrobiota bacterium]